MWPSACSSIALALAGSSVSWYSRRSSARAVSASSSCESWSSESPSRSRRRMISRTRSTSASRVDAVLALRAVARRPEQADLLVVADRPRGRAGQLGDLADPQRLGCGRSSRSPAVRRLRRRLPPAGDARRLDHGPSRPSRCDGRAAADRAPRSETPARHHSAVCMLTMNGVSCAFEMWSARPEKTANRTLLGTDEVTTASTNAIEITAPVFWTRIRAPAAMPRRCGANRAHHRGRVGGVEHPRADPDDEHVSAARQVAVSRSSVVISASPAA